MIPSEYKPLISKLTELTSTRKIEWNSTSDSTKFELISDNNSIYIQSYNDYESGVPFIGFEIRTLLGNYIDGIYLSSEEIDFDILEKLYSEARRNAMKIEQTISSIMAFLYSKE